MTVSVRDWQWQKWMGPDGKKWFSPRDVFIQPMLFGDLYADKAREIFEMNECRPMVDGDLYA